MADPWHVPVIVGVGDINDRAASGAEGLDSVALMAVAAGRADADAGGGWLERCDWLAITPQISFRDLDVPATLPGRIGIAPRHVQQPPSADGDTPLRHLNDAANAIGSGEAEVCLIVGGEAVRTAVRRAAEEGRPFTLFSGSASRAPELRRRYGLITATDIYPLYENACRAAWGQTLDEAQAESGEIWSTMSQVAAHASGAWLKTPRSPSEITTVTADNRPIAFPYTKFMVANSSVNQGAAVLVTSLGAARAAGIAEDRLVFVGAGASAHEDDEPLARAEWTGTPGMVIALGKAVELNGIDAADYDHVELYSCFPCVPKMARRLLGLPVDRPFTVHGGLTFGGGPIGNYMMHAIVGMTRRLREEGEHGLLFGNGGHCTHNHALALSRRPFGGVAFPQDYHFQAEADAARGPIPAIAADYAGPARVETYTVLYGRDGAPTHGVIVGRAPDGTRVLAKVDGNDAATIALLTDGRSEPVGMSGDIVRDGEHLRWQPAASPPAASG